MKNQIELSIILLCYRSEESIIGFAEKVRILVEQLTLSYEIIFVANYIEGSDDTTQHIVTAIAKNINNYRTICKAKKGMMGWDMKEGLAIAKGKYLCVIDGDGQFPIESIADCYKIIKSNSYGLVKTYRRSREDGYYRKFISLVYNFIFSILFPTVNSKDINSKPKIMNRKTYERMNLISDDWFIDAEIMLNINKLNINFYEIPIDFYKLEGRSSFVKFPAIIEFIKNLIKARFGKN